MEGQRRGRSLRRKFLPVLLWLRGAGVRCLQALRRRARGLATAAAFTVALAGCTPWKEYLHNGFKVGPNYSRPPAPVAQKWIDEGQQGVSTKSDELRAWWTVFQDPVLNDLVCCAVNQNLNVRQAGFRVLQYRALLGFAIGRLFPQTQTFDAGYNHTAVSIKVANRFATPQRFFSTWGYGFNLGWELDFWGKYRRFIEEYQDRYDAQIEDYDAVLVTLLGDVANEYVQMRTLQAQLAYTLINVKLQEETLGIAQTKYNAGQINELDVDQATSILQQTRALVPQLEIQIRQAGNRLCVLLGIPPEDLAKKLPPRPIPNAPPEVCVGIPAQLLTRRPDIRQAEREAAAESARIGIEVAELYPAISVVGNIGWGAEYFTNLFNAGAWRGSVGPSVDWKLLYYGRILSLINARKARFQEAVVAYQQKVLTAAQEAENGIVTFIKAIKRVEELQKSVEAARKAVDIALAQYRVGTVDFNRVSFLEQNLVNQQNLTAQAQGEVAEGLILTYRALGGGWQVRLDGCPVNPPISTTQPLPDKEDDKNKNKEEKKANGDKVASTEGKENGPKPAELPALAKVGDLKPLNPPQLPELLEAPPPVITKGKGK